MREERGGGCGRGGGAQKGKTEVYRYSLRALSFRLIQ